MRQSNPLIIFLVFLTFVCRVDFCYADSAEVYNIVSIVEPTCTEDGYTRYESLEDGSIIIRDEVPATGHHFSEWEWDSETSAYKHVCAVCGEIETRQDAFVSDLPIVRLSGDISGISKSDRVTLGFSFESSEASFSCYAYTTWQGHASLAFPKKNYTIRLYDDAEITKKHKLTFRQWQREHKYILKANYRDPSQSRNLIAADIWADMAATRPNLPEQLCHTSHYGAVDGFPVVVYLNDEFHGLYTMNLHIDDDLYAMRGKYDAVMIANESGPEETRFHAPAAFIDEKSAWEVEYCSTDDDVQWAKDKLNALIAFVMDSDDEQFRGGLHDYLDVDGAIDYLIFIYTLGLPDNAAKDLVLLTYDDGIWIPTVYDLEHAFGLKDDGTESIPPTNFMPEKQGDRWYSATNSLLWDRLLNCFEPEIQNRYNELRQTVLTEESIINRITGNVSVIPTEYIVMDLGLYPRNTEVIDPLGQMEQYIAGRLSVLDEVFTDKKQINESTFEQTNENGGIDS